MKALYIGILAQTDMVRVLVGSPTPPSLDNVNDGKRVSRPMCCAAN